MSNYNSYWDEVEPKTGFTYGQIEWLHETGQMPDWAYCQVNGKDPNLNYYIQTRQCRERLLERMHSEADDFNVNITSEVKINK